MPPLSLQAEAVDSKRQGTTRPTVRHINNNMRLLVQSRSGLPAFDLTCGPLDSVDALTSLAATKVQVKKGDVKLSHQGRLLEGKDTVQQLGLLDGDAVLLHVKVNVRPVAEAARPWRP